jgi:hypothetical protein
MTKIATIVTDVLSVRVCIVITHLQRRKRVDGRGRERLGALLATARLHGSAGRCTQGFAERPRAIVDERTGILERTIKGWRYVDAVGDGSRGERVERGGPHGVGRIAEE